MGVVGSHYSNLSESERMELLRDAANQLIGKEKLSLLEPELYGPGEVSLGTEPRLGGVHSQRDSSSDLVW